MVLKENPESQNSKKIQILITLKMPLIRNIYVAAMCANIAHELEIV